MHRALRAPSVTAERRALKGVRRSSPRACASCACVRLAKIICRAGERFVRVGGREAKRRSRESWYHPDDMQGKGIRGIIHLYFLGRVRALRPRLEVRVRRVRVRRGAVRSSGGVAALSWAGGGRVLSDLPLCSVVYNAFWAIG